MTSPFEIISQHSSSYSNNNNPYSTEAMAGLTPRKIKTASSEQFERTDRIQSGLQKEFEGHVFEKVSVLEFVEHVWGLNHTISQKITDAKLELLQVPLEGYRQVLREGQHERELHEPFRKLARGLLKDVCKSLSIDEGILTTYFWDGHGNTILKSNLAKGSNGQARVRKPDLLEVYIPVPKDGQPALNPDQSPRPKGAPVPTWHEVRVPVEFKKKRTMDTEPPPGPSASGSYIGPIPRAPRSQTHRKTPSSSSNISAQVAASFDSNAISGDSAQTGSKRSADTLSNDDRATKKPRVGDVAKNQFQLATYALECLYVGNRHYVAGLHIDGFSVKLWYYDRTAAMCTDFFDFGTTSGTANLALTLFALSQCTMQQAGFDPYLYKLITLPEAGQPMESSFIAPLDRPEKDVTKLCYKFPALAQQKDYIFTVQKTISRYFGVTSRGTTVIAGKFGSIGEALPERLYVLKTSWQYITRRHEGDIITQLRSALPGWTDHLPDPAFHTTITGVEVGLPSRVVRPILEKSGRTDISDKNDRDLHVIVTNRYKNIWQAKDVEEFKRIFLECLECHYHAYHTGRVLHRDISENNLMIFQPGQTDKDPSQPDTSPTELSPAKGILNDFDMAATLNSDGEFDRHHTPHHHITGTLPFMAFHLLASDNSPTIHHYRYDLESFYYVLIWASTQYDLQTGRRVALPKGSMLEKWSSKAPEIASGAKAKLYLDRARLSPVRDKHLREEWRGLWADWIEPLHKMFLVAFSSLNIADSIGNDKFDFATCGGMITFEKFMEAIGETPRGLNPVAHGSAHGNILKEPLA